MSEPTGRTAELLAGLQDTRTPATTAPAMTPAEASQMMSDIVAPPNGSVVGALNLGAHLIRLPGMARPERCTVLVGDGAHGKPVVGIRRGTDWRVQWLDLNTKLGEVTGLQMCDQVTAGAGCPAHAAGTWRALRAKLTGANVVDCTKPVTP